MKTNPVSFGSLMAFHIKDNKPHAPIPELVKLSFLNNDSLRNEFNLQPVRHYPEIIDGTIHNANQKFAKQLDYDYYHELPKGSKDVILTEVDAYINPKQTEKRYFITGATDKIEKKLHRILSASKHFFVADFKYRK